MSCSLEIWKSEYTVQFYIIIRLFIYFFYNLFVSSMFDIVNITGFQAFGNVDVNPTELIIDELRKNPHYKLRRIQKLDVTVKEVDNYVNYLAVSCNPK